MRSRVKISAGHRCTKGKGKVNRCHLLSRQRLSLSCSFPVSPLLHSLHDLDSLFFDTILMKEKLIPRDLRSRTVINFSLHKHTSQDISLGVLGRDLSYGSNQQIDDPGFIHTSKKRFLLDKSSIISCVQKVRSMVCLFEAYYSRYPGQQTLPSGINLTPEGSRIYFVLPPLHFCFSFDSGYSLFFGLFITHLQSVEDILPSLSHFEVFTFHF